jgi:hypothetical protein
MLCGVQCAYIGMPYTVWLFYLNPFMARVRIPIEVRQLPVIYLSDNLVLHHCVAV